MDLPSCPTCGQSVLDEDASECPFCGASMTGKPSAAPKKPPSRSARPEPRAPRPAAEAKPPSSSAAVAGTEPQTADDDPFSIDPSAAKAPRQVVRLHPKPKKGQRHRVVCRMCETVGYTSRKAAGKEVRCANSKCMVPIFTAPELPNQEPVEEAVEKPFFAQPKGMALAAGLVGVLGFAAWFFLVREDQPTLLPADRQVAGNSPAGPRAGDDGKDSDETPKNSDAKSPAPQPLSFAELQKRALDLMPRLAADSPDSTRLRARQLTVLAHASAGDLDGARKQFEPLRVVARSNRAPVYEVQPLVAIAWQELKAAPEDAAGAAKAAIDEARRAFRDLPPGRVRIDSATALASVLFATGGDDEARTIIEGNSDPGLLGQLSARLNLAHGFKTFDLHAAASEGPAHPWSAPQWVAVTLDLAAHGQWDRALGWAQLHPRPEGRSECVTAWAEALVANAGSGERAAAVTRAESAAAELPASARAGLLARIAARLQRAGEKPLAEDVLKKAHAALSSVSVPAPVSLPDKLGPNLEIRLPDAAPLRMAAVAAAEIGRAEAAAGRPAEAWTAFSKALGFARGTAPSPAAVKPLIAESRSRSDFALRNRLAQVLGDANERLELQALLLQRAVECDSADLAAAAWSEIKDREASPDPNAREPYSETVVPYALSAYFRRIDRQDLVKDVQAALKEARPNRRQQLMLVIDAAGGGSAGQLDEAARLLSDARSDVDRTWREEQTLRLACRLVKENKLHPALQFAHSLSDSPIRMETFGLIAALATRHGQGREVWEVIDGADRAKSKLLPADRTAVCYGFIVALSAAETPPDDRQAAAETQAALPSSTPPR